MQKALVTGVTGQDGSYMADLLVGKGIKVYGMIRRTSTIRDDNYRHLLGNPLFETVCGDLTDGSSVDTLVREIKPDFFLNFAAQSFVGNSWKIPMETFMSGAVGVLHCLEAIRKNAPLCRFYNAGSSEQFGDVLYSPQDEKHPFRPRSPYAAAKCAAHALVKVYRESYCLYAIQGILMNHESSRRGAEFVTRKITKGLARIVRCIREGHPFQPIRLGNLDAKRDWSHAEDFMDGVWRMMSQQCGCKEYVLASGETHSVREFVELAVQYSGLAGSWNGTGVGEKFIIPHGSVLVEIDPAFYRLAEVQVLQGDPTLAKKELCWTPRHTFSDLVWEMVDNDRKEEGL